MIEEFKKFLENKRSQLLILLCIFVIAWIAAFLFPVHDEKSTPPAGERTGVRVSNLSKISVSDDEKLIGIMSDTRGDIAIRVFTADGGLIYKGSLRSYRPHPVVAFNKITFSPDGRFAAFSINDRNNNTRCRIFLLDLRRKEIVDLSANDRLGPLGQSYESKEGPVWLDNATLIYVHKTENSAQGMVFVNLRDGREVFPRKEFSYTPCLSHSRRVLAYSATDERGKTRVYVMHMDAQGGRSASFWAPLDGSFNNVSQLAWSLDDRYLAFSYQDEQSSREGTSPLIVYDARTRMPVARFNDYLSNPQWLDDNFLLAGYWAFTPFHGQNVHTFARFVVLDVAGKRMTDSSIKAKSDNLAILPYSGRIATVQNDRLLIADIDSALKAGSIDGLAGFYPPDKGAETAGASVPGRETLLDVNTWKTYKNANFGVSFRYPSDWSFLVASGAGYLNATLGKGTDGIEINLISTGEKSFNRHVFEKTITDALGPGLPPHGFSIITLGGKEFYIMRKENKMRPRALSYDYYLNAPIYGKAFKNMAEILIFKLNSFAGTDPVADPGGDSNTSHRILKMILSTLRVEDRRSAS